MEKKLTKDVTEEQKEVSAKKLIDYPDVEEDDNYSAPVVLAYDGEA